MLIRKRINHRNIIATAAVAAFMLLFPASAFAIDEPEALPLEGETAEAVTDNVTPTINVPEEEELLEGFLTQQIETQTPVENPKKTRPAKLNPQEKTIYDYLRKQIGNVAEGKEYHTVFRMPFSDVFPGEADMSFSPEDFGLEHFFLTDDQGQYVTNDEGYLIITEEAEQAIYNIILSHYFSVDILKILNNLLVDEPYSLYWFDKTQGMDHSFMPSYDAGIKDGAEYMCIDNENCSFVFAFTVSEDYWDNDADDKPYVVDPGWSDYLDICATNIQTVLDETKDLSDYKKLEAYKDTICELVTYNRVAMEDEDYPYGDPWQLLYVFDGNPESNVVCEGYSKAFKYLCDLSTFRNKDLIAYLMTGHMKGGTGEGPHMWNLVQVADGQNYMVDVTNCDEDTIGYPDELFMKGCPTGKEEDPKTYDYPSEKYVFYIETERGTIPVAYTYDEETLSVYDEADRSIQPQNYIDDSIDITDATVTGITDRTYSGSPQTQDPVVTVNIGDETMTLVKDVDYTLSYKNNTNAGTGTVTITGIGDCYGAVDKTFKISPLKITPTVTLSATTYAYSGAEKKPTVTVKNGTAVLKSGTDYTVTYSSGRINVGSYSVSVSLKGNYSGAASKTFTISPLKITPTVSLSTATYTYNGTVHKPAVTAKNGTKVLKSGTDYTVTYAAGRKNAGKYSVKVSLKGNYSGAATKYFTINKANNTLVAKGKTANVSFAKLKKANQTIAVKNAFAFSKAVGKATYKKTGGNGKILVNAAGKVTVKKGLKKGTYKVSVKVTAAGNANYKAGTKTVTTTVRVK